MGEVLYRKGKLNFGRRYLGGLFCVSKLKEHTREPGRRRGKGANNL